MSLIIRPFLTKNPFKRYGLSITTTRSCVSDLSYSDSRAYKGHGKTVVNVLNRDVEDLLLIDSYSRHGFRINSGLFIIGPAAFFPRTVFHWDIASHHGITPESLSLFWLLEPRVDILLIGTGDQGNMIPYETRRFLQSKKLNHEVLSTADACGQFNFLNADNRNVACALLPPAVVEFDSESDWVYDKALKRRLFTTTTSSMDDVERLVEARLTRHGLEQLENIKSGKPTVDPKTAMKAETERETFLRLKRKYPKEFKDFDDNGNFIKDDTEKDKDKKG